MKTKYLAISITTLLLLTGIGYFILRGQSYKRPPEAPYIPIENDTEYTCPKGWVNCMPGPRKLPEICNDEEYQEWAKENCPGFEGIAY